MQTSPSIPTDSSPTIASPTRARHGMARTLLPLAAVAALAAPAAFATSSATAEAQSEPVVRVAGEDRHATAANVALAGWGSADHVLLATSRDFPDAVAAAPFAAALDAPLLLTDRDALPAITADALGRLGTSRVTVLGGPAVVSDAVVGELEARGIAVERVQGDDRYATAALLAQRAAPQGASVVALALGQREDGGDAFPDALAAATLSGVDAPVPVLLTRAGAVPTVTSDAIGALGASKVLVLGGPAAVSDAVVEDLRARGLQVERLAGDDRYETAVTITDRAIGGVQGGHGAMAPEGTVVATGRDFVDALAAGALAAHREQPLLLVPGDELTDEVDGRVRSAGLTYATVVGGSAVVGDVVLQDLEAAVTGQPRPVRCDPAYSSPDCSYTYRHSVQTWERLAECESNGNWQINTGNGYYGGLQFARSSWRGVGGSGYPHEHSKWEQIHRGELLQQRQGWGAWPACSRKTGLR